MFRSGVPLFSVKSFSTYTAVLIVSFGTFSGRSPSIAVERSLFCIREAPSFSFEVFFLSFTRLSSVLLVTCACMEGSQYSSGIFSWVTRIIYLSLGVSTIPTVQSPRLPGGVSSIVGIFTRSGCNSFGVGESCNRWIFIFCLSHPQHRLQLVNQLELGKY